jgi:hypothetical protein
VVGRELGAVGDLQGLKSYVSNILEHTLAKPEILRGSATDKATACVQPSLRSWGGGGRGGRGGLGGRGDGCGISRGRFGEGSRGRRRGDRDFHPVGPARR